MHLFFFTALPVLLLLRLMPILLLLWLAACVDAALPPAPVTQIWLVHFKFCSATVRLPPFRCPHGRGRLPHAEASGKLPRVVRDGAVRVHGGGDGDGAGDAPQRHLDSVGDSCDKLAG